MQLTIQEAFNKSVLHMFKQGRPAKDERGQCGYRLQDGLDVLMCAVGCLIPDDLYVRNIEGTSVSQCKALKSEESVLSDVHRGDGNRIDKLLDILEQVLGGKCDDYELSVLQALQTVHDVTAASGAWIEQNLFDECSEVAKRFKLTMPLLPPVTNKLPC